MSKNRLLSVAFEGCCHSELDKIYSAVAKLKAPLDLLIIGGDFQAVRNHSDLNCMSVPRKYLQLGDFADYYSGRKTAPILTVFIGGNHEASNYLWELYYGGWVAKNIYYLGAAGVIDVGGVRIAGLSGIFNRPHYFHGHHERMPYSGSDVRSAYHIRQFEVLKLYQLTGKVEIALSHDWPAGIEHHGDLAQLLRVKKHFKSDITNKALGSPPAMSLLKKLKPKHWFSAHLHVKYPAIIEHKNSHQTKKQKLDSFESEVLDTGSRSIQKDTLAIVSQAEVATTNEPNEKLHEESGIISVDHDKPQGKEEEDQEKENAKREGHQKELHDQDDEGYAHTRFLALDKCLPRRKFLQAFTIPSNLKRKQHAILRYDPEWLAITKAMEPFMSLEADERPLFNTPEGKVELSRLIAAAKVWVNENIVAERKLDVPLNFQITAPVTKPNDNMSLLSVQPKEYENNQTQDFCNLLEIPNRIYFGKN
ncbi:lariat debranching enzyme, C-terminal domain-containing protein [Lipomyces japonicus]|uniref:lariat debranching enzyme, C-terminal domain-containing protein n=1 Tax=Lipomyces japonicus TaxID=56871 RepID=UPI0034CEA0A4